MKHLVVFSQSQIQGMLAGDIKFDFRFFKKRPDFFSQIHSGDLVFFRKFRGDLVGQFEIGKLIVIEKIEKGDWDFIAAIAEKSEIGLAKADFEEKVIDKKVLIIIQITKLEQFITPPIEINKRARKEWVVLEN